jgi:outer membrane protein
MKKLLLLFSVIVLLSLSSGFGQKYAFVDTEYILGKIPSYKTAQEQLDQISKDYQKEIETAYAEVEKLYKGFQTDKVLMTEDMKQKKEDEIVNKEKLAKDLQKKYFGKEGELFKKRQELIKPIQDEVFNAVKDMADQGNYVAIFDLAAGATILYANSKYDKSDEILEKLGYKK